MRSPDATYDFLRLRRHYLDNVGLQHLADIHRELGRYSEALQFAHRCVEACHAASLDATYTLHVLRMLGHIHVAMGHYTQALESFAEDLRIIRGFGEVAVAENLVRPGERGYGLDLGGEIGGSGGPAGHAA